MSDPAAPEPRSPLVIRPMTRAEVDLAVEWAAAEGWNPGLHDADCFYAQDPEGFLLGEVSGEPVGCISAVRYGDTFGFAGFFIVRPQFRGGPFGFPLGNAAQKQLGERNVGQDGVVAQQGHYKHLWNFEIAHRNVRYERKSVEGLEPSDGAAAPPVPLAEVPFAQLSAYDREMFGVPREAFLRCWISRPGTVALGTLDGGRLTGYGVIRPCRVGHKIGPLFADTPVLADTLFRELAGRISEGPVYLDVPQTNLAAVALAERHGMSPVFETARMYTKGDPGLPLDRIFGITSFELG